MCGLIASITSDTYATRLDDWWKDAFMISQVRGTDSAGMFQLLKNGHVLSNKQAKTAVEFIKDHNTLTMLNQSNRMPLSVGHVRAATQGASDKDENAHPFRVERADKSFVIGVHNGTLRNWKSKEGSDGVDVDSNWAFKMFAEHGPIDAFEYFNGPFAFIWYDSNFPRHVFMARNDERTLFFHKSKDNKTLTFLSEVGMLGWLSDRHRFDRKDKADNEGKQLFWIDPSHVYKFSLDNVGEYEMLDRPKYDPATTKPTQQAAASRAPFPEATRGGTGSSNHTSMYAYRNQGMWDEWDWGSDQTITLEAVKLALRGARYQKTTDATVQANLQSKLNTTEVVDDFERDTRLADAMATALSDGQWSAVKEYRENETKRKAAQRAFDPWKLVTELYKINEPNVRKASSQEIKLIKDTPLFGRVVQFNGVLYDDDNLELLGEAYIKPVNGAVQTYDVVMRGVSEVVAKAKYIDANETRAALVIGAMDDIDTMGRKKMILVTIEVTPAQERMLGAKMRQVEENAATVH